MQDTELDLIQAEDGMEVPKGVWYEIFDCSDRDYGNEWGWKLYDDGKIVDQEMNGIYSRIRKAGDDARQAKKKYLQKKRRRH